MDIRIYSQWLDGEGERGPQVRQRPIDKLVPVKVSDLILLIQLTSPIILSQYNLHVSEIDGELARDEAVREELMKVRCRQNFRTVLAEVEEMMNDACK